MAQHDYVIANGTGAAVRSDLNNGLAAIVSNNSGATEPATMYAYQWWPDTTTGLLKQRNSANNAWVTIGTLASANLGLLPLAGGTMTGVLAVTAGTAALPGIAVSGDLNTGLVSPGADQLAITTGGTSRLAVSTTAVSSTLPVDVPLGAVGTPSLTFTGDLNTGLFSPGADTLALVTGGTNRVHVTSGGLVGIGSNSPQEVLDVNGRGRFQGSASSASSGAGLELGYVSASTKGQILSYNRGTSTYLETNIIGNPLTFNIGGSEAARIDTSSRLLVGTSTARSNLYGGSLTAALQVEGTTYSTSSLSIIANGSSSTLSPYPIFYLGRSRGASVGLNTIVASGDNIGSIVFTGADGTNLIPTATIECFVDGTPGTNDMPGRLVFSTTADGASSPTERMRIGQTGYLKASNTGTYISTAGVYHELVANGADYVLQARNSNAAPYGIYVNYSGAAPNGTSNEFYVAADTGGTRFSVRSNGGITNYSANNINLSDRNVKKDITPASGTWDCIKEWEIVNFRYKDQPDDADLNLGVIAQQVAESCPEVITVFQEAKEAKKAVLDEDGNELEPAQEAHPEKLGVKDQQMMWMAIKALQEAQIRIETLEAEVAALKGA